MILSQQYTWEIKQPRNPAELNEFVERDSDDEQNEDDDGELVAKPGIEEIRKAEQILEGFNLFSQLGEEMLKDVSFS